MTYLILMNEGRVAAAEEGVFLAVITWQRHLVRRIHTLQKYLKTDY